MLRVFIITDGGDNVSPPPFRGMGGMDPMMKELRGRGFNIEFHIVFVSSSASNTLFKMVIGEDPLHEGEVRRYRDLSLSTGGGFLNLSGSETDAEKGAFLLRISAPQDLESRVAARKRYEELLLAGDATRFDWYKTLPPK